MIIKIFFNKKRDFLHKIRIFVCLQKKFKIYVATGSTTAKCRLQASISGFFLIQFIFYLTYLHTKKRFPAAEWKTNTLFDKTVKFVYI